MSFREGKAFKILFGDYFSHHFFGETPMRVRSDNIPPAGKTTTFPKPAERNKGSLNGCFRK